MKPASRLIFHIFLLPLCMLSTLSWAQAVKYTTTQYVEMYKDIAIEEMKSYKIPASITLAQGILESDNGNSVLARNTNNHFGIKCKAEWTGAKYYHDDDAAQECFRKYLTVKESYHDHSLFLTTRKHYALLFSLDIKDYRGWAKGLKQAGYATNPAYAELLISIIETYKLNVYDEGKDPSTPSKPQDSTVNIVKDPEVEILTVVAKDSMSPVHDDQPEFQDIILSEGNRNINVNNGVHYITTKRGDSFESIATDMDILLKELCRYNDVGKDYKLTAGEIVYIEQKKEDASVAFHTVVSGETMHIVSQRYGIRLRSLYSKNRMKLGTEAETGQRLWLQDNAPIY